MTTQTIVLAIPYLFDTERNFGKYHTVRCGLCGEFLTSMYARDVSGLAVCLRCLANHQIEYKQSETISPNCVGDQEDQ